MSRILQTKAIVLSRTNYGEADRILNLITPEIGTVSAIAKGVRRERSRLAGGVELLAVSDLTLHRGKGDLWIVTGARLETFFGSILHDYDRLQFAYYVLRDVRRASETVPEPEFYDLLLASLRSLNTPAISLGIIDTWYRLQMAILLGVGLNLATDDAGQKLAADTTYRFDVGEMAFVRDPRGAITTDHIKYLRVASANLPETLGKVNVTDALLQECGRIGQVVHE